jgi:hypothetical protein
MKSISQFVFGVVMVFSTVLAGSARAQHYDLSPRVVNGKIVVGYHNDGFTDISPLDGLDDTDGLPANGVLPVPVYGYDVALNYDLSAGNADDHYFFSEDPGLNSVASPPGASPLPASKTLTSNLLSFLVAGNPNAANLFYWDGMAIDGGGNPVFAPATGTTLTLARLNSVTADGSNSSVIDLIWGNTSPTGSMHVHADTIIDDTANPGAAPTPPAGVYLIGLEFAMEGLTNSDAIWAVYAAGVDEELHDIALGWVSGNPPQPVPEPGSAIFAIIAGLAGWSVYWRKRSALA